jgi:hypothetical protein
MVEGVVLVVNGKTPKQLVRTTRAKLNTRRTKILGLLLKRSKLREMNPKRFKNLRGSAFTPAA